MLVYTPMPSSLSHAAYNAPIFTPQNSPLTPSVSLSLDQAGTVSQVTGTGGSGSGSGHRVQYMAPVPVMPPLTMPPKPLRNLHIDNLPPVTEASLRQLFAPYGRILRVRVVTDDSGGHAGYGFVMFEREDEARHAMEEMDHCLVFSDYRYKIPPKTETPADHGNDASIAGAGGSEDISDNGGGGVKAIHPNHSNQIETDDSTAFAPPPDAAVHPDGSITLASGVLLDSRGHIGKRLRISFARHRHSQSSIPNYWLPVNTNLYVAGLAPHYSKHNLDVLFSPYGQILESRILLDRATGNSRGVGFVRFASQLSCQNAIRAWNGRKPKDSTTPITVRYAVDRQSQQISHLHTMQSLKHASSSPGAGEMYHPAVPQAHSHHQIHSHSPSHATHYQHHNPYDVNGYYNSMPLSPLSPLSQSPHNTSLSSMLAFDQFPSFLPLTLSISPPQSPTHCHGHGGVGGAQSGYHSPVNSFTPPYFFTSLGYAHSPNAVNDGGMTASVANQSASATTIVVSPISERVTEHDVCQLVQSQAPVLKINIDRVSQSAVVELAIDELLAKSVVSDLDQSAIHGVTVSVALAPTQ